MNDLSTLLALGFRLARHRALHVGWKIDVLDLDGRDLDPPRIRALIEDVLQIVIQSILAAVTRHRVKDERDKLIQLRGYRAGYITFATLMVFGLGMLWMHTLANAGGFPVHAQFLALHFLNVFYGILVISDIVKTVAQIVTYRRGA